MLPGDAGGLAIAKPRPDVEQQSHQPADHGAVDPHELQIASHRQLDPPRGHLGVPGAHRIGDQLTELVAVIPHQPERRLDQPAVHLGQERLVLQRAPGQRDQPALHRPGSVART